MLKQRFTLKSTITLLISIIGFHSGLSFAEEHQHHHDDKMVIGFIKKQNKTNDLPSFENVKQAIISRIEFQMAQNQFKQAEIEKNKYQGDNYEFNVGVNQNRRHIKSLNTTQKEWGVELTKTIRLPHKNNLDDQAGNQTVSKAQVALEDNVHESLRLLLKLWFNYSREVAQKNQWQQQVDILKRQYEVSQRRVKGGDVPKLEAMLSQASYSQAQSQLNQAELKVQNAYTELHKEFKALDISKNPVIAEPQALTLPDQYFLDLLINSSHELKLAKEESKLSKVLAKRTRAERLPDPTFGINYSSEGAGDEKVIGVSLSIPIPNDTRRKYEPDMALKTAESASLKEALTVRKVEKEGLILLQTTKANYHTWQDAKKVADTMRKNADILAKAYSLGEADLMDTLSARKQSIESNLTATLAQIDAQEAYYKLLLDSHLLWDIEEFIK